MQTSYQFSTFIILELKKEWYGGEKVDRKQAAVFVIHTCIYILLFTLCREKNAAEDVRKMRSTLHPTSHSMTPERLSIKQLSGISKDLAFTLAAPKREKPVSVRQRSLGPTKELKCLLEKVVLEKEIGVKGEREVKVDVTLQGIRTSTR